MNQLKKIIIYGFLIGIYLANILTEYMILEVNAETKEYSYSQTNLDIMFVVDCSNSMNANDKNKMALQMIGTLVDTAFSSKTRIGYVEYNHNIISSQKPQEINTKKKREVLRKKITQIQRSGSTDIGQALKHAKSLLNAKGNQKSIIILISDGETDLTYANTGRTKRDSDNDMYKTAAECNELGIPIYTIAFSDSYDGDSKILDEISKTTKAVSYKAPKPADLIDIFNQITKGSMMSSIIPIGASMSSGKLQSIKVPITNSEQVREANILVVSTSPIEEANLFYKGSESSFHKSQYYFTGKIINPKDNKASLQLKTEPESDIKIYLQLYHDLDFRVKIPHKSQKNQLFEIEGYFFDRTSKKQVTTENFYKEFVPTVEIIPLTQEGKVDKNREKTQVKDILFNENMLKGNVLIKQTGKYKLNYKIKSELNALSIKNIEFEIINTIPEGNFESELTYHKYVGIKEFDLNQYFTDGNQDQLTYQIVDIVGDSVEVNVDANMLKMKIIRAGNFHFKIQAEDGDGGSITSEESVITILPIWKYYIKSTIAILMIVALCLVVVILFWINKVKNRPKPYYSGKLNIYFTRMPDDMEIEALTFMLYPLETSEVSLGTLLSGAGIDINQLDSNKVKFLPSFDKKTIFCHNSVNNVMLGSSIACKGLKYSMEYGNKIYITSKEEEYELEIHYVSSKV